jgi:hypothetical protein
MQRPPPTTKELNNFSTKLEVKSIFLAIINVNRVNY